ncbi:MAG2950 family lipoprotein [Mycoplasmopsis agalactiae]|uniref:MAG2950 family lipoprotein n=1 Tax=Mycoplasmopsis agalactiae TaxID=2110 RepID=UPI001F4714D6|nr:hypothetical protein [Mycoplasmopsis agalactiae]MCE6115171.1 hypothetical protein [Mycoplasmopsis agalactiae]
MKKDAIKSLSVSTLLPLSVVSTFAFISASCEASEKVNAINSVNNPQNIKSENDKHSNASLEGKNPSVTTENETLSKSNEKSNNSAAKKSIIIEAPAVNEQSLKDLLKDKYPLFTENIKEATDAINKYSKDKNDANLYLANSLLEQVLNEISNIDSLKSNENIKKSITELKSVVSDLYDLFESIDNNEFGIKELEKTLSEIKGKFEKIKNDAETSIKDAVTSISFLVKILLEKAEAKIKLNNELGNKDLAIASGYIDELLGTGDIAKNHLDAQIAKLTKDYQEANQKYQEVKKKFDEIDTGWYRFRSFFSWSMRDYYNKLYNELTQNVNKVNSIVGKIDNLKKIKAELTKIATKKAK